MIILLSTLIPVGAFALNPKVVGGVQLKGEAETEEDDDSQVVKEKATDGDSAGSIDKVQKDQKTLPSWLKYDRPTDLDTFPPVIYASLLTCVTTFDSRIYK